MLEKTLEETLLQAKEPTVVSLDNLMDSIIDNDTAPELDLDFGETSEKIEEPVIKEKEEKTVEELDKKEQPININIVSEEKTNSSNSNNETLEEIANFAYANATIVIVVTEEKPITRLQFDFLKNLVNVSTVEESLREPTEEKFLELKELRKQSIKIQIKAGDNLIDKGDILPTQVKNLMIRLKGVEMEFYLNGDKKDIELVYALQK